MENSCLISDCESKLIHARGLCKKHYKREQMRDWRSKNKERAVATRRSYYLSGKEFFCNFARRYSLDVREAEKIYKTKPSICEVCKISCERICYDHNHQTGKFRGWLCNNCNTSIGQARDDPTLLKALAIYLEER